MATTKKKTVPPAKPVKLQVKTGVRAGKPGRTTYANITLERTYTSG